MSDKIDLDEYKQQVADYFDRRTNYDSESEFHPTLAHRLIERANIREGQTILDIATGTGLVAIEAAQIVGDRGYVVGVDISPGMLDRAKRKIEAAGLTNIEMRLADVETVEFSENSFDRILCCCAVPYIPNIPANLRRWWSFLKPGGLIGITGVSETAYIMGIVVTEIAQNYGIKMPKWNEATGTEEKCYQ